MPNIEDIRTVVYSVEDSSGDSPTGKTYHTRYADAVKAARDEAEMMSDHVDIEMNRVANLRRNKLVVALLSHEGWCESSRIVARIEPVWDRDEYGRLEIVKFEEARYVEKLKEV